MGNFPVLFLVLQRNTIRRVYAGKNVYVCVRKNWTKSYPVYE